MNGVERKERWEVRAMEEVDDKSSFISWICDFKSRWFDNVLWEATLINGDGDRTTIQDSDHLLTCISESRRVCWHKTSCAGPESVHWRSSDRFSKVFLTSVEDFRALLQTWFHKVLVSTQMERDSSHVHDCVSQFDIPYPHTNCTRLQVQSGRVPSDNQSVTSDKLKDRTVLVITVNHKYVWDVNIGQSDIKNTFPGLNTKYQYNIFPVTIDI